MVDARLLAKPERVNGEDKSWKDWRFIITTCLTAAPSVHNLLERAENGGAGDSVLCANLFVITKAGAASTGSLVEFALRRDKRTRARTRTWTRITARRRTLRTLDASKTERTKCIYCGKVGHGNKSTSEEKPHNINEMGATGSGP